MVLTTAISRTLVRSAATACAVIVAACGGSSSDGNAGRSAPAYGIGGTFTGLAQGSITIGVGLDRREITTQGDGVIRDIAFEMPSRLPSGASYDVQVLSTDSNVSCEVRAGSGVVASADVKDILIQCFSTPSLRLLAGRLPKPDVDGIATDIAFIATALAAAEDGTIYLGVDPGLDFQTPGAELPRIRRITPTGFLTTIAGGGVGPAVDGRGGAARLIRPRGLVFAPDGSLLFADGTAVRRVTSGGAVTTLAGSLTEAGAVDTPAGAATPDPLAARFNRLNGLVRAPDGTIYVTDNQLLGSVSTLRSIAPDGRVSTLATTTEQLNGLAFGLDGQLYVGLSFASISGGGVGRLRLGTGSATLERLADLATPPSPQSQSTQVAQVLAIVPETATSLIALGQRFGQLARFYTDGRPAELMAGGDPNFTFTKCLDGRLSGAQFNLPFDMTALGPGKLLVADSVCQSLRLVDLGAGRVSTLYGSLGFGTADGTGPAASFHGLSGLAFDPVSKRLVTTEALGLLVRTVGVDGTVATLVGEPTNTGRGPNPTGRTYADGSAATATFAGPSAIIGDGSGDFFLLDRPVFSALSSLRRVDRNGNVTTLRSDVPRNPGQTTFQQYMALDPSGSVLVSAENAIWRLGQTGVPERIAGDGTAGYADSPATSQFNTPGGIVVAKDGTVFVADTGNRAIRRIATDGTVSAVAGRLTPATLGPNSDFTAPVAVALTENEDFLLVLDNQQFVVKAIDLRPGRQSALRTIIGKAGSSALALGPLPGSLAPPYQVNNGDIGFLRSTEWTTHALLVKGSKLYIALGDVILEADLALR